MLQHRPPTRETLPSRWSAGRNSFCATNQVIHHLPVCLMLMLGRCADRARKPAALAMLKQYMGIVRIGIRRGEVFGQPTLTTGSADGGRY